MNELDEMSYLAGFFDGEGCIGVYQRGSLTLQVTVAQKNPLVLEMFAERWLGGVWNIAKSGCWSLAWYADRSWPIIQELGPYLIGKKDQVTLALEFIEIRKRKSPNRGNLPEDVLRLEQIAQALRDLKRVTHERAR